MKLIRWDCCSVVPSISCAGHTFAILPLPPLTTLLVAPKDCECLTSQKSDPRGSLLLPQAPANLSPLHWESIWKVRRDRRGGRGGLLWSIDTVTDTTVSVRLFLSFHRSNTNSPSAISYSYYMCVCSYLWFHVCLFFCLYSSLSLFLSFMSFFNCTHGSRRLWCMHSWSWQSRPGNVWFTDPLLTYWFDLPFTFQRPGILTVQGLLRSDSACLTTVENHSKYAASWLTDILNGCDTSCIKLSQKSGFLTTRAMDPHLLTPFVTKNLASLVLLKYYSTLQFYWNNNTLAVKLQAECKDRYIWSYASLKVTPLAQKLCNIRSLIHFTHTHTRSKRQGFHVSNQWTVTLGSEWNRLEKIGPWHCWFQQFNLQ